MIIGIKPCRETRGKERVLVSFAWLPVTLSDNTIILWQSYKIREVVEEGTKWDEEGNHGYGKSYPSGEFSWVVKEKFI